LRVAAAAIRGARAWTVGANIVGLHQVRVRAATVHGTLARTVGALGVVLHECRVWTATKRPTWWCRNKCGNRALASTKDGERAVSIACGKVNGARRVEVDGRSTD